MSSALSCPEEKALLRGETTLPAPRPAREVSYEELQAAAIASRRVVVLAGYSGAGYQHPEAVEAVIADLVKQNGGNTLYVAGATKAGIGAAYAVIRREAAALGLSGVRTAGLVSELARDRTDDLAEMDMLCYVPSPSWEVTLPNGWSANVDILRGNIQPRMVCLGGGKVAAVELAACVERGFPASVYAGPSLRPQRPTPGVLDPLTGRVAAGFLSDRCTLLRAPALAGSDLLP